jgi:hypothetical protein
MKKILFLFIVACCLIIITATGNANKPIANLHLFSRDTLPLTDTAAQNKLHKDTFGGLKDMVDSNNLKAKSDSLHKHPPKK